MEYVSGESMIAFIAVLIAIMNVVFLVKHNKLSVMPHLVIFDEKNTANSRLEVKTLLINKGLGPAKIKEFNVYLIKKGT
ncbi:hypothetical protein [Thiohalophilus sp.]|uniref:hypothetical protein n=1 Tax=Thiohalophilus sp. TaxID=3028392 RepID=UPI002ACF06CC|nr:hypothetical protein [Thiohalophilus sp.]MDZ7660944.1 hypothetical protein [Thiohalophilus sp.]